MADKNIKETRKQESEQDNQDTTSKDKTDNSPRPKDKTESKPESSTPVIDEEAYNDQLALQGFHRVIPESVATPSKKYIKAIQRFDRKSTNVQPAEFWKFDDKELKARGRF